MLKLISLAVVAKLMVSSCWLPESEAFSSPLASSFGAGVIRRQVSHHQHLTQLFSAPPRKGFELAGLLYDSTSTAFDAWEWTAGLGAPAALVAGAVLVTLSENRDAMVPRAKDGKRMRFIKLSIRLLLVTSFAFELASIFVSTTTGTVLLSQGSQVTKKAVVGYACPLGLLHHHHEFEYLTIQIGFLQGLMNWLAAVALELFIPKERETLSARRMNKFMASCLLTQAFWILAFFNHHLTFYSDYGSMLLRFAYLGWMRFFGSMRPMAILYGPSTLVSIVLGWRAFRTKAEDDLQEE